MKKQEMVINYLNTLFDTKKVKEGDMIPSENSLVIKLNVSRNTVRLALAHLVESNILIPIRGKGYIYNEAKSTALKSYSSEYGRGYSSVFVKEKFIDDYEPILKTKGYYELIKVRYKGDKPFILTVQRISPETMRKLKGNYKKSLYAAFFESNIKILYAKKSIRYIETPPEVKILMPKIDKNTLLLQSLGYTFNNIVIEVSNNYYYPNDFTWEWVEKRFK